ncbi:MAG: hypothetical protein KBD94_03055 [Pyrinomonadaceae bacterium]|nr:hypothetical protein [Pyrinomonadaceae bacterium]
MNSKLCIQKAVSTGLLITLIATYSMVTLANSGKAVGELIVNGSDDTSFVMVNGEPSKSGRTVFSSSTITTPEAFGATVSLGKTGRFSLAPNSTFALNVDGDNVSGDLTSGSITVLSAAKGVSVKNLTGDTITVNAGESANAATAGKQTTTKAGGLDWWAWVLLVGGAAVVIAMTARAGNDSNFGGGSTTVSPVR